MNGFHHVSKAFSELGEGYQKVIEDVTMRMGAGMAKFICKEVETVDEYDEYCHYVAGLVALGLNKLFHAAKLEDLASAASTDSLALFFQKMDIIRDYLEDMNEMPQSRKFWPREIWNKYANKLEDFKHEENSAKAVECLNDMVTDALLHAEGSMQYLSTVRDSAMFRFWAIPQIIAMGTLALCYNNINVFRGAVSMRPGLTAKIFDRTKSMSDVYGAFFDFSSTLKSKIDKDDPNASKILSRIEAIQKVCRNSVDLKKRRSSYILLDESEESSSFPLNFILVMGLSVAIAYLLTNLRNTSIYVS